MNAEDVVVDYGRQWEAVKNRVAPFPHLLSKLVPKAVLPNIQQQPQQKNKTSYVLKKKEQQLGQPGSSL